MIPKQEPVRLLFYNVRISFRASGYRITTFNCFGVDCRYTFNEIHSVKGRADCIVGTDDYICIFGFKRGTSAEEALQQIEGIWAMPSLA